MPAKPAAFLQLTHDRVFYLTMCTSESVIYAVKALINLDIQIDEIQEVNPQKFLQNHVDSRAVSLDIEVKATGNRNVMIEMQVARKQNIARRIRYMISVADNQMVDRGTDYNDYPEHIVIVICDFDPFPGIGMQRYRIYNHHPQVPQDLMEEAFDDGVQRYLINLHGNPHPAQRYTTFTTASGQEVVDDCVLSEEGQDLINLMLDYNYEPKFEGAVKIKERRAEVTKDRSVVEMLRVGYDRDEEIARANFNDGIAIGKARGIAIGEARGQAVILEAMKQLASKGLTLEDAIKIVSQQTQHPGSPAPA